MSSGKTCMADVFFTAQSATLKSLFLGVFFTLFILWLCSPAFARIYQYKDSTGAIHFTDDISKIPEDQRPPLGPRGYPEIGPAVGRYQEPNKASEPDAKASTKAGKKGDGLPILEEIQKSKADLNGEYAQLMKERNALKKERSTLETPEQVRAYKKKVKDLNRRIEAYQDRHRAYQKKVYAYNAALKEEQEE